MVAMEERQVKQYIIVRTDLGMSAGKIGAQAAHASQKVFFDKMIYSRQFGGIDPNTKTYQITLNKEEIQWVEGKFTKIVKKVKNEAQLIKVYEKAKEAGLNCSLIEDAGLTELTGKNHTCIAIGPNYVDKCEPIVKRLRNLTNVEQKQIDK